MSEMLKKIPKGGQPLEPWFIPDDWSRLQYGRILWKNPELRQRLLDHWTDERHPYRERFSNQYRLLVERILTADPENDDQLDAELQEEGHSLRTIMREIPPVFGSFW